MEMGFQFEQHRLGSCDLSWDLKKTICWEMGLGPPFTTLNKAGHQHKSPSSRTTHAEDTKLTTGLSQTEYLSGNETLFPSLLQLKHGEHFCIRPRATLLHCTGQRKHQDGGKQFGGIGVHST